MKNTLVMLVAVMLMMTGCVSRTYVNRSPNRNARTYGHYDHHRYDRNRYDHSYGRNW